MRRRRRDSAAAGNAIHLRPLLIRSPGSADLLEIAALLESLVARYLAPNLNAEGLGIFRAASQPSATGVRWAGNVFPSVNPALVAIGGARIVGYGEVRDRTHVTELFVAEDHHGRGIGSRLITELVDEVRARNPQATEVTLNAAPSALVAYLRMGFQAIGPRYTWHGITAQPMALQIRLI